MKSRVFENKNYMITNGYSNSHKAVDVVGENSSFDYVVSHSDGKVIYVQDGYGNMKGSTGNISYGNYVKVDHGNGYVTLYAHLRSGLVVRNGEYVKKGQRLGYMGDSGNAYGAHLHFEVIKNGERINPTSYLDSDLYDDNNSYSMKYKVGDIVEINGVYVSSVSKEKLMPAITRGVITKIIDGVSNPYLLDNGNIGWVNDSVIVSNRDSNIYLSNPSYNGVSIVDALNEIRVDSSYSYRSKLANVNGISNYSGSATENTMLLNLLKSGKLKKA